MGIKIYTYPDPYRLEDLPYWKTIKECPIFTASQTLASGMKALYGKERLYQLRVFWIWFMMVGYQQQHK